MPRYQIEEHIIFEVEADSAQGALNDWLQNGEEARGYAFNEVTERWVYEPVGTGWREAEVEE